MLGAPPRKAKSHSRIEVRPNPASTLVNVILRGDPIGAGGYLTLSDAKGVEIERIALAPLQVFVDLNVAKLPSGLYRLTLFEPNRVNTGVSLSIAH